MNCPAVPLITIDPYFSVWAPTSDDKCRKIQTDKVMHWTGAANYITGEAIIDGVYYSFLGTINAEPMKQVSYSIDALSTQIIYSGGGIILTAVFTSPLIASDLYLSSRPAAYLHLAFEAADGNEHSVSVKISVGESLVLNNKGDDKVTAEAVDIKNVTCMRIGSRLQKILNYCGDDVRISWGYLYLASKGTGSVSFETKNGESSVSVASGLKNSALFIFAYDDISSIIFFGEPLKAYWKKDGKTITDVIAEAADEYDGLMMRCKKFSSELERDALKKGGQKYAELLMPAYRQVMAGHKLVRDKQGKNLYISKECFSNGSAATVDVTYPSAPLYLYYNTELLKGMLRPIFLFAGSDGWKYDFAPHDLGTYPVLNGQTYWTDDENMQMPVEECGNMLILTDAICRKDGDYEFAVRYFNLLEKWSRYLVEFGEDPQSQLCTDDFAGHLSHNCNLSIKAIMGIAGFADILKNTGKLKESELYFEIAEKLSKSFINRAENSDGSFRLAYDRPETFSLKYNAVWDRLWKTNLFDNSFYFGEIARYIKEALPYGVPLDSRELYTKSDWLLWVGCFSERKEDFEYFAELLWKAFNTTRSHVPMTDWYYADTAEQKQYEANDRKYGFQHRTVQGGLFMKLLL